MEMKNLLLLSSCIIDGRLSLDGLRFETMKDVSINPIFDTKIKQERKNVINQLVYLSPVLTTPVHNKSTIKCILVFFSRLIWGNDMNQTYSSAVSLNKEHHMNLSKNVHLLYKYIAALVTLLWLIKLFWAS